ncbi:hypothetical protein SELMODRAFT_142363 [Selaginella moellendorffii]|nr:hypothetical protein SELMODRAFT_142363 [Selaginella moellendorffii]
MRRRIVDPVLGFVRRGTEPKQLALSGALGITLGVFPVYGATALLCALAALVLRSKCHVPLLMLANLVATPIELSLIIPFLRVGEYVLGAEHIALTTSTFKEAFSGHLPRQVIFGLLYAVLGWIVASPFIFCGLYAAFLPMFQSLSRKVRSEPLIRQGRSSSRPLSV